MQAVFRRAVSTRMDSVFGVPLARLLQRERRDTPIVLTRLIQELEKRGVDYNGIYILRGSVEKKKHMLREDLERNPLGTDLSVDAMPDTKVLAYLVKDFLRELPEPLVPPQIHAMLLDAASVVLPNDINGSRQLIFRVIDCLSTQNMTCLMMVLDHLVSVLSSTPHNGLSTTKLCAVFAPLLLCCVESAAPYGKESAVVRPLDVVQASATLQLLIEHWPSRVNDSESGGSSDSPTCPSNTFSESQC